MVTKPLTIAFPRRSGVTLFEMAIVLTIIGLLIGAIVIGKDLFITARDRSIIKESKVYSETVSGFQLKYSQLPGDMDNPTKFWPSEAWSGQGNADGVIVWAHEGPEAWRQMELAGMLKASNMSIACTSECAANPGTNIPRSSTIANAGWTIGVNNRTGDNIMLFGAYDGMSIATYPVLPGKEAWYLDKKIDDGNPNNGIMRARNSWGYTECISSTDSNAYNLSTNAATCNFDVMLGL